MINIRHASQTGSLFLYDLKGISNFIFYPEETVSRFLWNTGDEIPEQAVSLPRTRQSSRTSLLSRHQDHDLFIKHHHHQHHQHHHLHSTSGVRSWYTCFTKHVTLTQLTHSKPNFLNSISILSSNCISSFWKFWTHPFVWIPQFVYMCTCSTYLIILHLMISGLLSDTDQHLWKSHSRLIQLETLTLPIK